MFGTKSAVNEAAFPLEFDDVPPAIPIRPDVTKDAEEGEAAPALAAEPLPEFRTLTLVPNQVQQVADMKPFKRNITLLHVGAALQFELCYRPDFSGESRLIATTADLPFEVPVYPGQKLFMRQATLINHDISIIDAPLEAKACIR